MKVLVVGASGVLGRYVCKALIEQRYEVVVGDYKAERGRQTAAALPLATFKEVDVTDSASLYAALQHIEAVIVVVKQEYPLVQKVCIEKNIPCIDVTVDEAFIEKVQDLKAEHTASILMAGFFPGLSGILIQEAISTFDSLESVSIGLLQSTNANAGITGITDMLRIVNHDVDGTPGFSEKRNMKFGEFASSHVVRKIEHVERKRLLQNKKLPRINYYTAWEKKTFNIIIRLLQKTGLLGHLTNQKGLLEKLVRHNPTQPEQAYLTIEAAGLLREKKQKKEWRVRVRSDYETTAAVTVALVKIVLENHITGIHFPYEITSTHEILKNIDESKVRLIRVDL